MFFNLHFLSIILQVVDQLKYQRVPNYKKACIPWEEQHKLFSPSLSPNTSPKPFNLARGKHKFLFEVF